MPPLEIAGPVAVEIDLYPPTAGKWDLDNRIKQLLDALQAARLILDDEQVVKLTARKFGKIIGGHCILKIQEVDPEQIS